MLFTDHWWVILQLGLAAFAGARGWGFSPWGVLIFGILFTSFLANIIPARLFVANIFWPDMLVTLILFVMVANGRDEEHEPLQTERWEAKLRATVRDESTTPIFKTPAADEDKWEPTKRTPGLLWEPSVSQDPFARRR